MIGLFTCDVPMAQGTFIAMCILLPCLFFVSLCATINVTKKKIETNVAPRVLSLVTTAFGFALCAQILPFTCAAPVSSQTRFYTQGLYLVFDQAKALSVLAAGTVFAEAVHEVKNQESGESSQRGVCMLTLLFVGSAVAGLVFVGLAMALDNDLYYSSITLLYLPGTLMLVYYLFQFARLLHAHEQRGTELNASKKNSTALKKVVSLLGLGVLVFVGLVVATANDLAREQAPMKIYLGTDVSECECLSATEQELNAFRFLTLAGNCGLLLYFWRLSRQGTNQAAKRDPAAQWKKRNDAKNKTFKARKNQVAPENGLPVEVVVQP